MTNEEIANRFLQWFSTKYTYLKNKMRKYCSENQFEFDEDIFSDTYMKVYEKILKNGINDTTDKGFEAYFFMAYRTNIRRECQYKRVSHRDLNYSNEEIETMYDEWYNDVNDSSINKVRKDLYVDWSVNKLINILREEFGETEANLFVLKTLSKKMTYKQLQEKYPNERNLRQRIVEMKKWLREFVDKQELDNEFQNEFDSIL